MRNLSQFEIRRARESDFEQIVALLQKVDLLADGLAPGMLDLYVAETDRTIVGCAALESDGASGLLRSVGVLPTARGAGVGERLVDTVHARAKDLGLKSIYVLTTTAEKYFPRFGYKPIPGTEIPRVVTDSAEHSACLATGALVLEREIKKR